MKPVSLISVASYLPEKIVDNDFFKNESGLKTHSMFRGTKLRHHIGENETCTDMATIALTRLAEKININLQHDVDILMTNVTIPDIPFVGPGASIVGALKLKPKYVYDLQNGGCVSFIFMMELARAIINSTDAKNAVICNFQTAAGRILALPDNRKLPQSAIPGDGCGVAFLAADDSSPIEAIVTRTHGEYANDMRPIAPDGRKWWEPGVTAFNIDFNKSRLAAIVGRGNKLVPEVLNQAMTMANVTHKDIGALVTNQPNKFFLRNWRESVLIPEEKQVHTFDEHGNLFGAAIPICFERGIDTGVIKPGEKILLGGFSHAGDYTASAVIHWQKKARPSPA
ncbi:MAG: 3-oxoacyl-ACP synthase [Proteobacteria bacterium]|nr:3-oxoacyl-ACP synthase [Pseudomonadota bacterium]